MDMVSKTARLLAVILSVVSAFVISPVIIPVLLLLGGVAAIGNTPDRNAKNYLMTLVLVFASATLQEIPFVGPYLATMFGSLGAAFIGASIVAITITLEYRIQRDWLKKA